MLIIDSQVHIWGAATADRPWPPGRSPAHRPQPFSKDDLLAEMDAAGVARVVIVPPSWEGDRNDLALAAARLHPDRFAVMGRLAVERAGLPVMLSLPGSVPHVDAIAERHPGLKLVIDHLALSRKKDDDAFEDLPNLLALARRPNVAVKASALPRYSTEPYPYRGLHPYIRRVFDAFGPRRMFWGTDLTSLPCSYGQAVTFFTEELPWLSASDQEWVMGRGAGAWLGWPLPG
jgi:predicted TIM-barrel fold metal-dependent hydrolase